MKKSNGTKKSLIASGISVLLCVALFVGTTFAWFTDSVTSKGNRIQSGNLLINAYAYDLAESGDNGFTIDGINGGKEFYFSSEARDLKKDPTAIISEKAWEPGQSNAKLLKVENAGTLAAKIKLDFSVKDASLVDALWFDFVQVVDGNIVGQFTKRPMKTLETFAEKLELPLLEKGDNVQFILFYGMNEEAGNEYQRKAFSADVSILATQNTKEQDAFGNNQYDKDAQYLHKDAMFINSGESVSVDLNETNFNASGCDGVFNVTNGSQLTLDGNGSVVANDVNKYAMAVWAEGEGSKVIINGGTYTNNKAPENTDDQMDMIYVSNGADIEINGGTFKCITPKWTLNIRDDDYKNGLSTIVVKGGSFFEYDPSNATNEALAANFVPDGYKVITEEKADGTWYTVVKA